MTACRIPRRRLPALLSALALALGAAVGGAAETPTGRRVAEVIPTGLKSVDPNYVRELMRTRKDGVYDDDVVNKDVQILHNTRLFVPNSVKISTAINPVDGRVTVFVEARELMGVTRELRFVGAQHLSEAELLDLTGIRKGGPMNPAINELARTAILNKLREDGRYYASVELTEGRNVNDTRVIFQIVEGPVCRVRKVGFHGNTVASSARLATQVVTGSALIPGVVTVLTPKYNPASIEEDRKKLVMYYHRQGYLDMRVKEEVVLTPGSVQEIDIIYHIEEGGQYRVRNVKIDDTKTFDAARLRKVTKIEEGKVYDIDVIQADEKRIETLCGNGGHKTFVAHEKYAVEGQPGVIDVHYRVEQRSREPDRVGNIYITGNDVTRDRVILNQLGFYPGQILQYPKLDEARGNLIRTGLFDTDTPPTVEAIPNETDSTYKDIRVTVKEARTGSIAAQVNVNSDSALNGSLVLNQRNFDILRVPTSLDDLFSGKAFRGGGQELRLEAQPGTTFQRYAATFREPYLYDSRFGLTIGGYYYTRNYAEYEEARLGIKTTIDYRFAESPIWRATLSARLEDINISNIPAWATRAITDDAGHSTIFGLRAGLNRDTRDSYLLPTSGSVIDFGVEQVVGGYTYPIATLEASKYWTLWQRKDGSGKQVLSARTQLTVEGGNTPVFDRVFAGGIRSMRGFTFRGVGPFENNLNVGGTFGFLNSIEYQVPVLASDKLYWAAFVDHGTVERSVSLQNYRVAIGTGVRIVVPALGPLPIALDFAVPLARGPFDNKQVFSFYMGFGGGSF